MKGQKLTILYYAIVPALACMLLFTGCIERGCTDKGALNYNSLAHQDDGSCLYCSLVADTSQRTNELIDDNFSSDYFNQQVARLNITRSLNSFNYTSCNDLQEEECFFYYHIENLVNENISFFYRIRISGSILISTTSISLAPFETSEVDTIPLSNISSFCNSFSSFFPTIELSGFVNYN